MAVTTMILRNPSIEHGWFLYRYMPDRNKPIDKDPTSARTATKKHCKNSDSRSPLQHGVQGGERHQAPQSLRHIFYDEFLACGMGNAQPGQ